MERAGKLPEGLALVLGAIAVLAEERRADPRLVRHRDDAIAHGTRLTQRSETSSRATQPDRERSQVAGVSRVASRERFVLERGCGLRTLAGAPPCPSTICSHCFRSARR